MPEGEAIDLAAFAALKESVGGDSNFVAELVNTYLDEAPQLIATMKTSLDKGDVDGFRRAAHSLKSSSANFGATQLSGLARELEGIARGGTLDGVAERLPGLDAEYGRVASELTALSSGA